MEFEIAGMSERDRYFLLTNVVVPRPIAWVTSMGGDGTVNAAPFSFFNVMSATPPVVGMGITGLKDTVRNVLETKEFVIHVVTQQSAQKMNVSAIEFPHGKSEIPEAGLRLCRSKKIKTPAISNSPVHIECKYRDVVKLRDEEAANHWIMGDIQHIHVDDEFVKEGRVLFDRLSPLGRLGGSHYTKVDRHSIFKLKRIPYEKWQQRKQGN